jgi:hypothetical protein
MKWKYIYKATTCKNILEVADSSYWGWEKLAALDIKTTESWFGMTRLAAGDCSGSTLCTWIAPLISTTKTKKKWQEKI